MAEYDCLIAGAGASGLTMALALAQQGRRVAVIGKQDLRSAGRTVALFDGSLKLLQALGLGPRLAALSCPLETMRIVDDTGSLFRVPPVDFTASEIGLPAFGINIENAKLVAALAEACAAEAEITLVDELIQSFSFASDRVVVTLQSGARESGLLLIAADGRSSPARNAAGIKARVWSYPQTALTLFLSHTRPHHNVSTEFHTRAGPFTLVPLPGTPQAANRSSLVWMMKPRDAERRLALDDAALAREIETQAHSILGAFTIEGGRGRYPMSSMQVADIAGARLALVGDAAHGFPPIGAQGLNLGLRDVAHLAECIEEAGDPGSEDVLGAYRARRTADIAWRTAGVDGLNRALLDSFLPIDFLRGAGLVALSRIGPLRRAVMRQGVAPQGRPPRLMAGTA
jgi:2-octaprenyl-6-methoxyphenol hydroxylase